MSKKRAATQSDVARVAQVSQAVVSHVLSGRRDGSVRVAEATAARVHAAARELGYVANPIARNLAKGQSGLLGVFTFESIFPRERHHFYHPFLLGIEAEAEVRGFDLLLFTSAATGRDRRIFEGGINRLQLADGAILMGGERDKSELRRLAEDGFPFVFVGRREVPGAEIACVAAGYAAATVDVVHYLVELGHRRIAYLGLNVDRESVRDREAGYRAAFRSLGLALPASAVTRIADDADPADALAAWRADGITAVVVENEVDLVRLHAACATAGLRVPDDLSLALLGDPVEPARRAATEPVGPANVDADAWTRFLIPRRAMGAEAVRLLLDLLDPEAKPNPHVVLPCTFVAGTTTAPPRHPHAP